MTSRMLSAPASASPGDRRHLEPRGNQDAGYGASARAIGEKSGSTDRRGPPRYTQQASSCRLPESGGRESGHRARDEPPQSLVDRTYQRQRLQAPGRRIARSLVAFRRDGDVVEQGRAGGGTWGCRAGRLGAKTRRTCQALHHFRFRPDRRRKLGANRHKPSRWRAGSTARSRLAGQTAAQREEYASTSARRYSSWALALAAPVLSHAKLEGDFTAVGKSPASRKIYP